MLNARILLKFEKLGMKKKKKEGLWLGLKLGGVWVARLVIGRGGERKGGREGERGGEGESGRGSLKRGVESVTNKPPAKPKLQTFKWFTCGDSTHSAVKTLEIKSYWRESAHQRTIGLV